MGTGRSLCWLAAAEGRLETLKLLLRLGADAKLPDKEGKTPLKIAESRCQPHVALFLRAQQAVFNHAVPPLSSPTGAAAAGTAETARRSPKIPPPGLFGDDGPDPGAGQPVLLRPGRRHDQHAAGRR